MPLGIDEVQWLASYLYRDLMLSLSNLCTHDAQKVWYFNHDYIVDK